MKSRYERNIGIISPEENESLKEKSVCVIGCGGLGGTVIECLTRLGIGRITAVDCDVFDVTNLNRQVLSNEENIGLSKTYEAEKQMNKINPEVKICPINVMFDESNGEDIVRGHDVVVDAMDNISSRKMLEKVCRRGNIPLVHGAIGGWYGQVAVIMPGESILERIYPGDEDRGEEQQLGNPSFTPAIVAGMQASETLKILLGRENVLKNELLTIDLLNHQYDIIDFEE